MLDRPLALTLIAAPSGLILGAIAWIVAGGAGFADAALTDVSARSEGFRVASARAATPGVDLTRAMNAPLFSLTNGKGAIAEPTVRLTGLARSPRRVAALISINDAPPAWLAEGETRDGVTLLDVGSGQVTVDTTVAVREVRLGEASLAQAAAADPGPALAAGGGGPRGGLEPASAPASVRP